MDVSDDSLGYLLTLRKLLRATGVTNSMIAKRFATSERTVSRWFQGRGLTVAMLTELCRLAGVSLIELLEISAHEKIGGKVTLSHEQERVLASDDLLIFLFVHLLRGWTISELRAEASIPEPQLQGALARLDSADLIRCRSGGAVRLLVSSAIGWRPDGPVLARLSRYLNEIFFPLQLGVEAPCWESEVVKLSSTSRAQIKLRMEELRAEIRHMARNESLVGMADRQWTAVLLASRIVPLDAVQLWKP